MLGYSVDRDVLLAGSQIDILLKRNTGPLTETYVVECKDYSDAVSVNLLRTFHSTLLGVRREIPSANGIFVSKKPLTKEAKAFADSVGVQYFTLSELDRKLIDLDTYARHLVAAFEESSLSRHYVPLDASVKRKPIRKYSELRTELRRYIPRHQSLLDGGEGLEEVILSMAVQGRQKEITALLAGDRMLSKHRDSILKILNSQDLYMTEYSGEQATSAPDSINLHEARRLWANEREPLLDLIQRWMSMDNCPGMIVLGDYGTGKTSFIKYLAFDYAKQFLASGGEGRCPLVIDLKNYPNGLLIQSLQADIAQQLNCRHLDWNLIRRYLSGGRFLMLLDGFDEMGFQIDSRLRKVHFASILKLFDFPLNKVIVTGRPSYFPTFEEYEELLGLLDGSDVGEATRQAIMTVTVAPFTEHQIEQYINSFSGDIPAAKLDEAKRVIAHVYNLRDLAERPFLLDLIIKTIPESDILQTEITPATLYKLYTKKWIDREFAKGEFRWLISKKEKLSFMTEIAWEMLLRGNLTIHFSELADWVRRHLALSSPETVDYFAHDLRTCTFLARDDFGNYSFIHRSFMEYFVAVKMVERLKAGEEDLGLPGDASLAGENANSIAFALDILGETILEAKSFISQVFPPRARTMSLQKLSTLPEGVVARLIKYFTENNSLSMPDVESLMRDPFTLPPALTREATAGSTRQAKKKKKDAVLECDFCGLTQQQVKRLIAGPKDYICNNCVDVIMLRLLLFKVGGLHVQPTGEDLKCSFCGKFGNQVKFIFSDAAKSTFICDECHEICIEIITDDELASAKS